MQAPRVMLNGEFISVYAGRLDLSSKGIEDISVIDGLGSLKYLQTLVLANNCIHDVSGLDGLESLRELDLSNNAIEEIKGLDALASLRVLILSGNRIMKIQGLDHLEDLRVLKLARNRIQIVENLDHLSQLRILDLSSNNVHHFTGSGKLINLRILDLNHNGLETIDRLDELSMIHELYLRDNELQGIESLDKLAYLRELEIDAVPVPDEIMEELGSLNKLSTDESRQFIHFFSTCPVCGKENHDMSLAEFFFSTAEEKKNLKRQLLTLMNRLKDSNDADGKRVIGIPCCECFEKLRE
ncbi:MAG TPA: leucine-rich repeat domain-containing protein [Candidatus Lokiarchaeia archaeon]|nr:leucine-rich repeat domain-containing protein [Candidatus Lokiarchaeia archaeon]